MKLDRREFLTTAGALVVGFAIPAPAAAQGQPDAKLELLDAWLAVGADARITVFCGKVELGTGIETALAQIVADELDVAFERVLMVMGDTSLCPNQGPTVGSQSVFRAGPQLRQAAADARATLVNLAAARLGVPAAQLSVKDGVISGAEGRSVSYADLVGSRKFNARIDRATQMKSPSQLSVVGKPVPRVELPAKVFGGHVYVHNLRLPGMLHGRVVRPPIPGAQLESVNDSPLKKLPGGVRVVVKGNFVGVVAEREEQAIRAAHALKVKWKPGAPLPDMKDLPAALRSAPASDKVLASSGDVESALAGAAKTLKAEYFVPYQMHASIGPSCAIAAVSAGSATLWSPTQSSFLTRGSIAGLLGLPADKVRVVWAEGSGCYGQNGADDCTADAALLAQAVGRPVRVQWMRRDEHGNEPKGPAMAFRMRAGLDAGGGVAAWEFSSWSPNHSSRPAGDGGGNTLAGAAIGRPGKINVVGAERNARSTYVFPNSRVTLHLLDESVLRASALRGLGAPQNTFANESFIDELAHAAGADPIAFRIRHLRDERAIAVLQAAAKLAQWQPRPALTGERAARLGRGAAFVHYDHRGAYVGMVAQVRVERGSGRVRVERVAVAHDCGLIVNPDGLRNQIEGNVVQALSRALIEEVKFDRSRITSTDWRSYPILRFSDVPGEIAIELIDRPDRPSVGAGEPATTTVMAALANAIFDATGARVRSVPFTPARVRAALPRSVRSG